MLPACIYCILGAGFFKQSLGAGNLVDIWLSYRPARLHCLAELVPWNRFLGSLKVWKFGLGSSRAHVAVVYIMQRLLTFRVNISFLRTSIGLLQRRQRVLSVTEQKEKSATPKNGDSLYLSIGQLWLPALFTSKSHFCWRGVESMTPRALKRATKMMELYKQLPRGSIFYSFKTGIYIGYICYMRIM